MTWGLALILGHAGLPQLESLALSMETWFRELIKLSSQCYRTLRCFALSPKSTPPVLLDAAFFKPCIPVLQEGARSI